MAVDAKGYPRGETKVSYYRQCKLAKDNLETITWIPEKFARKGKFLELKGEDGWKVLSVGSARLTQDQVSEWSQSYKHQREVSDI